MLRLLYLSPIGYLISIVFNILAIFIRPFMVYGYWDRPTGKFRKLTRISSTTVLIDKKNIQMGDNVWISHHSVIDGSNGVKIGEGVQISICVGIFSHSSHISIRLYGKNYINVDKNNRLGYVRSGIEIGEYSFIGAGACVLPGVKIGRGCLIAAGAIVNKDLPDFSIAAGNPARVIGSTLDMDKKYFDDPVVRQHYFDQEVIWKATAIEQYHHVPQSDNPESKGFLNLKQETH